MSFYSDIEGGYYGSNYLNDLNEQCKSKKKMLEGLAYEGIVKENNKQIDKYDLEVEEIINIFILSIHKVVLLKLREL